MADTLLPTPPPGPEAATAWVASQLSALSLERPEQIAASPAFRGGQRAADEALACYDATGYAAARNEVWPPARRGASALSPWIRHGLLSLPRVWEHVEGAPARDVRTLREELLWQEYARHLYARLGTRTGESLRYAVPDRTERSPDAREVWDPRMACLGLATDELTRDGWLVNQHRLWLAGHWTVRHGWGWRDGEDAFFTHLLDGSRAANRLGWQWAAGAGTGRPYAFSRWQVKRRAPGLCEQCELSSTCPVQERPADVPLEALLDPPELLRADPRLERTAGPPRPTRVADPDVVWLTAESLGDADPALSAYPGLPVLFVFDAPLLARLRLSGKRLVFLAETLADLATRRDVEVHLGRPSDVVATRRPAVTYAPVPGMRRRLDRLSVADLHPWPWLVPPHDGPVSSFSASRKAAQV
ncbi:MAG: FAD-binding domain-containing protein [Ornithinimicrobium sp.]|uniref:FAD-binding domain-containing protein n=1 Tax=Ornithinimicrobium sp. TaxID=1977084 RepID=UPI003D9B2895